MPTYVLRNEETGEEFEQNCSYETLQKMLEIEPNLKHILKSPNMVSDHKSPLTRAGTEWNNMLTKMKKNAGYRVKNTIKD